MERRGFKLYPEEREYWSFTDYAALLSLVERFGPRTVLEFGPGSSTLALVEGGVERVDSCEDDPAWFHTQLGRLAVHPVTLLPYDWSDPLSVPGADDQRYDMAFIDGPHDLARRPAVLRYCLDRCGLVVCPAERAFARSPLVPVVNALALERGLAVEWLGTGPWTHAMAVLGRASVLARDVG